MFESFDTIYYTAVYLLPGFFIKEIIDICNPTEKKDVGEKVFSWLALSLLSICCCGWVIPIVNIYRKKLGLWYWLLLSLLMLLIAFFLGVCLAKCKQKQLLRRVLEFLRIQSVHPTPCAWDYVFMKADTCFITVTLVDGNQISGLYSQKSFASSSKEHRDIFIEKIYIVSETGSWEAYEESTGILIMGEQIQCIEFQSGGTCDEQKRAH